MDCTCLATLCVGIEEYQHGDFPDLPNASRDANNFSREMLRRGFQDNNLFLLVGHVSQQKLKEGILKFLKCTEDNISSEGVQLLVVFIAAHGTQPRSSELPAILASDYENDMYSVLDLDTLLLKPLDSIQGGKIKAWFVVDTCRENKCIQTWTGHAENSLKRLRWSSETDFQILLACDRGRVASDQHSLTAALLCALKSQQSDLEAVCKEAQTSIELLSSGRQRPWRYCRGDFSGIFLPDEERPCMRLPLAVLTWLMRGTGCLLAAIVVLLWGLLESGITWGRIDQSGPEIIEVILDTCVFCMSLTVDWLTVLEEKRSPLAQNLRLTLLWWLCKISTNCSLLKASPMLAEAARIVTSVGYNILNACLLSSSIVLVLRLVALQPEISTGGVSFNLLAQEFLRGFLPMVFTGEIVVMWRCHQFARSAESIEHETKIETRFYVLCLYLGWICSFIAWRISYRITLASGDTRQHENTKSKLTRASRQMFLVKTVWCSVTWVWCSKPLVQLASKESIFAFVVERICTILTLVLLKKIAKLYGGLKQLPH